GPHPPQGHPQDLPRRRDRRARAQGHLAGRGPRRARGADGGERVGQEHADEHPRVPRPPDQRRVLARRAGDQRHVQGPARDGPQPQDRLRVPELQPARPHDRARQRRDAAGLHDRRLRARGQAPRGRAARARRPRRPDGPPPVAALRRPAAARRDRPGADQPPAAAVRRRAHRQPRQPHERGDPPDVQGAQRAGGDHDHPRDPRRPRSRHGQAVDPHQGRADRVRHLRGPEGAAQRRGRVAAEAAEPAAADGSRGPGM
ncbi:MAG: ABC-type antimicrobial peptide transport system, ATPase component, partial [uncultured Phycisphaerae bacterium]